MRMELIQPFINAADAVLSETLACPVTVSDISMNERHTSATQLPRWWKSAATSKAASSLTLKTEPP